MADSIERLSFQLTTDALVEQERAVYSLRTCAGTVLGAASIAGSFLGARGDAHPLGAWAIVATVAFIFCLASAILVLVPRELVLSFRGAELIASRDDDGAVDVEEAYRAASGWIAPYLAVNHRTIDRLGDWLSASCLFLAVEILAWTMSLTG